MGEVLAVVPARGGSVGIPRKSIVPVAGRPMLAWTAEAALGAGSLDRVVLSTDDEEMAGIGADLGLEVPFLRPAALAGDTVPMADVLAHALGWATGAGIDVDVVVLLQPTSPLRRSEHIDGAVARLADPTVDTVVTVVPVPHQFNPVSVMRRDADGTLGPYQDGPLVTRRQDKPEVWARNGPAVVATRARLVAAGEVYGGRMVGHEMSPLDSIDVDGPDDLVLVDLLLRQR
ncbi:MAG TPA: acylneuraminate cytidylyltransferase family protein [Iamia sp.]